MEGPALSLLTFGVLACSAMAGVGAHAWVPSGTPGRFTLDIVRRGSLLLVVLAAVFVGAMAVSLKTSFDSADLQVKRFAGQVVELDRTLRRAGEPATAARAALFDYTSRVMKDVFPETAQGQPADLLTAPQLRERLRMAIEQLAGASATPQRVAVEARAQLQELTQARRTLVESTGNPLSPWLLAIVLFWLMLALAALGLIAPRNRLVFGTLFGLAAALSGGMYVVGEFATPFDGNISISPAPIQNVLFAISE